MANVVGSFGGSEKCPGLGEMFHSIFSGRWGKPNAPCVVCLPTFTI